MRQGAGESLRHSHSDCVPRPEGKGYQQLQVTGFHSNPDEVVVFV
jgi:hypothetical protein